MMLSNKKSTLDGNSTPGIGLYQNVTGLDINKRNTASKNKYNTNFNT